MDLNDADQSCQNTYVRNVGENLEQETTSNNAPVKIQDKMDYEIITEDEKTPTSHKQQNGYFQKETESSEIVANIWRPLKALQSAIVDNDKKVPFLDYFYDHTSMTERGSTSITSGNLLSNTSEPRIRVIAKTNERDVKETGIIPFLASATNKSSNFRPTIIQKSENASPTTNVGLHKRDVGNVGKNLELEPTSNNAPEEFPVKMDSESIAEDEKTPASHKHKDGYFQKETESYEIVSNISQPSNAFQRTITDIDKKVTFLIDAIYDFISISERSSTSCTSRNLLPNTLEPRIHAITETGEKLVKETKIIPSLASPTMESSTFGSTIIPKCENSSPTSNTGIRKREIQYDVFKEDDDWDIYQPGIVTKEPVLNAESSQESQFRFERLVAENAEYLSKNNSKSSVYDSCQRVIPYIVRIKSSSPSSESVSNGGTHPERTEERLLKEVKEFFLSNPVQVAGNLSDRERKAWIMTASYFSKDFALKHGLPLPTISPIQGLNLPEDPVKVSKLFAAYEMISHLEISEEDFFRYMYIDNQRVAHTSPWQWYTYSETDQSIINNLDTIQEQVGADIFHMIYKQLRTDKQFQSLFRHKGLLLNACIFWSRYNNQKQELLREERKNTEDNFLSQNQADSTSDVTSEDILISRTNAGFQNTGRSHVTKTPVLNYPNSNSYTDNGTSEDTLVSPRNTGLQSTGRSHVTKTPILNDTVSDPCPDDRTSEGILISGTNADLSSTTSRSHVTKIPGLNNLESNSYADGGKVKGHKQVLKNSQSLTHLSKVQSIKPNDILETELKMCSSIMPSTNQNNKENRSSFDSLQVHSVKSNGSPNPDSIRLSCIQNSADQNNEEKPTKVLSVKLRNSPNDAKHSYSQNCKEKSSDDHSGKSYEVLEHVSNVRYGVRKCISQDDYAKPRKKIRLQENSNVGQPESKKEESPRKDESKTSSQESWPRKPENKSCIVM